MKQHQNQILIDTQLQQAQKNLNMQSNQINSLTTPIKSLKSFDFTSFILSNENHNHNNQQKQQKQISTALLSPQYKKQSIYFQNNQIPNIQIQLPTRKSIQNSTLNAFISPRFRNLSDYRLNTDSTVSPNILNAHEFNSKSNKHFNFSLKNHSNNNFLQNNRPNISSLQNNHSNINNHNDQYSKLQNNINHHLLSQQQQNIIPQPNNYNQILNIPQQSYKLSKSNERNNSSDTQIQNTIENIDKSEKIKTFMQKNQDVNEQLDQVKDKYVQLSTFSKVKQLKQENVKRKEHFLQLSQTQTPQFFDKTPQEIINLQLNTASPTQQSQVKKEKQNNQQKSKMKPKLDLLNYLYEKSEETERILNRRKRIEKKSHRSSFDHNNQTTLYKFLVNEEIQQDEDEMQQYMGLTRKYQSLKHKQEQPFDDDTNEMIQMIPPQYVDFKSLKDINQTFHKNRNIQNNQMNEHDKVQQNQYTASYMSQFPKNISENKTKDNTINHHILNLPQIADNKKPYIRMKHFSLHNAKIQDKQYLQKESHI